MNATLRSHANGGSPLIVGRQCGWAYLRAMSDSEEEDDDELGSNRVTVTGPVAVIGDAAPGGLEANPSLER